MRKRGKIYCRAGQGTDDYMTHAHCMAGYPRLQIHTQNMSCLLLFHNSNGCTNASQCYVTHAFPVLLKNGESGI